LPESTRSSKEAEHLWITVLAGGVGSRFWPVSTPRRPKQLLPLGSERPLIVDTLERARRLVPDERIRVLASADIAEALAAAVPDLPRACFWTEPVAKGTGSALAAATARIHELDTDAVIASLHADHVIRPLDAFDRLMLAAAGIADRERLLLTVGVPPERTDVGFGYVQPAEKLESSDGIEAFRVRAFHEKPDAATAESYVSQGYFWNSGIFVWSASVFLEELRANTPELARLLPRIEAGDVEGFFADAPNLTIDHGVFERSKRVGVLKANFHWDDVGTWEALSRTRASDASGNVAHGPGYMVEASDNVVFSDGEPVVLFGVSDLVVVRAKGVTLVMPRERASDLKTLLAELPESVRRSES
jgi:mannose-1-phosphate guanylyltransferase